MKKCGFTVAETLIVLGIIGILILAAVTAIKPFDKSVQYLYSNAVISLDRAYYNAIGVTGADDPFDVPASDHNGLTKDVGAERVCKALIRYINPVDKANSCKDDRIVSPMADNFPDDKIQFVSLNGMRFYTSGLIEGETANNESISFYVVFVDINGESGRGSAEYIPAGKKDANGKEMKQKNPDIFAFAVLPIGRIVPLGAPEVDTTFMTTRISYLNEEQETRFTTVSKPYYQTKADAWNYYTGSGSNTNIISADVPYTYNDAIRTILNNKYSDNLIYKNVVIPETTRDESLLSKDTDVNQTSNSPQCMREGEIDAMIEVCSLHIDNYAF